MLWSLGACSSNLGPGVEQTEGEAVIDDCADEGDPSRTVQMLPPLGIGDHKLGELYNGNFLPLQGPAGAALFTNNVVVNVPVNRTEHSTQSLDTVDEISLNAGLVITNYLKFDLTVEDVEKERYMMLMARDIKYSLCVDENQSMREVSPKASYYLKCIHYGYQHEAVIWGHEDRFLFDLQVNLFEVFGLGIRKFADEHELQTESQARGLCSTSSDAIFSQNIDDIKANYEQCEQQEAPIYIEFAEIPGSCIPPSQEFAWKAPVQLSFDTLRVDKRGAENWSLNIACRVEGDAGYIIGGEEDVQNEGARIVGGGTPLVIREDGEEVPITWQRPMTLKDGDKLICDLRGTAYDQTQPIALAPGEFEVVIGENGIEETPIEVTANDGTTAYTLTGRLTYVTSD